jgi:hypothetical protein
VIKLCPPNSASQLSVSSSYRYNLIPHCIFYFPGIACPKFQIPPGDRGFINNSSLVCKLTWISVENIHTQAIFWIASLHLAFPCCMIRATWFTTFFLLLYSLSLVRTKRQIEIVYAEELWGCYCHCPKLQLHNHQISEYVSVYNSHKIVFRATPMQSHGFCWKKWRKKIERVMESMVTWILRLWCQEGSVCL